MSNMEDLFGATNDPSEINGAGINSNTMAVEKDNILEPIKRNNEIAPFSEAQPSCPTCGEVFTKIFLNGEWFCTGVAVVDVLKREQVFIPAHLKSRLSPHCLIYHVGCLPKLMST